ncbi:hypothetical protein VPH35_039434 [Triticum aestivum]
MNPAHAAREGFGAHLEFRGPLTAARPEGAGGTASGRRLFQCGRAGRSARGNRKSVAGGGGGGTASSSGACPPPPSPLYRCTSTHARAHRGAHVAAVGAWIGAAPTRAAIANALFRGAVCWICAG